MILETNLELNHNEEYFFHPQHADKCQGGQGATSWLPPLNQTRKYRCAYKKIPVFGTLCGCN